MVSFDFLPYAMDEYEGVLRDGFQTLRLSVRPERYAQDEREKAP